MEADKNVERVGVVWALPPLCAYPRSGRIVITDLLAEAIVVGDSRPAFEFHTTGDSSWPVWDRFITIDKNLTFHIGNVCNTCDFFFTRVSNGILEDGFSPRIASVLNVGIRGLSEAPLSEITSFLPGGRYYAALSVGIPEFVRPGEPAISFRTSNSS